MPRLAGLISRCEVKQLELKLPTKMLAFSLPVLKEMLV